MQKKQTLFQITTPDEPSAAELVLDRTKPDDFDNQIDELVGSLCDPIIVWPMGGWGETLPENIKHDITIHRLLQLMTRETGVATWPEVCAYLYTVTLERPVAHEWVDIYMYAMTQYLGDKFPEELRRDKLDRDEERLLKQFRTWLWDARHKARREKGKAQKREVKEARRRQPQDSSEEIAAEPPMRPQLF